MRSFKRSTASEYWIRSLVPMLKNLTRLASMSAATAAEGISIMAPISMFSSKGIFSARNSFLYSSTKALAFSIRT